MKQQVIPWKELPTKCPLFGTIVLWLLLDRLDAAQWVWGAVGVVVLVVWIVWIIGLFRDEPTSVYGERKT